MVKLPPLTAPAFTRIKGIVNSFYVKYSSVWKYWNSFISDRPEDVFLSRSALSAYRGKFVEPRIPMVFIAMICKVAKGFCNFWLNQQSNYDLNMVFYHANASYDFSKTPVSWSWMFWSNHGYRSIDKTDNITALGNMISVDSINPSATNPLIFSFTSLLSVFTNHSTVVGSDVFEYARRLGFQGPYDLFYYCCQQCCRNLENLGVPTDVIARSSMDTFKDDFFNALPLMCLSSTWHNFYRSEQNQAPEFDFREVNGSIAPISCITLDDGSHPYSSAALVANSAPHGWWLKLIGIPPSVSSQSDYWYRISSFEECWSVLTGFFLDVVLLHQKDTLYSNSVDNVNVLPTYYNGLAFLKYRNFEADYFTSASVDPNMGGVSVQVPGTIDALRTASKFEEFLERGIAKDFVTWMQMQYNEKPDDDYSLPRLLGTQIVPVQIGEQLQTSQTTFGASGSPLGERAGIADAYGNSGTVNHKFNEHGFVFSLLSFVIDSQYKDGMPHDLFTHKQLDYPFPAFANLGAETIKISELYYGDSFDYHNVGDNVGNPVVIKKGSGNGYDTEVVAPDDVSNPLNLHDNLNVYLQDSGSYTEGRVMEDVSQYFWSGQPVFGYTPRYSKWKFKLDVVAGQMRDLRDYWHTFREFYQRPFIGHNFVSYLNASFINNINRIFAVVNDNYDKFYVDVFNNASVRRCLPLIPDTTLD